MLADAFYSCSHYIAFFFIFDFIVHSLYFRYIHHILKITALCFIFSVRILVDFFGLEFQFILLCILFIMLCVILLFFFYRYITKCCLPFQKLHKSCISQHVSDICLVCITLLTLIYANFLLESAFVFPNSLCNLYSNLKQCKEYSDYTYPARNFLGTALYYWHLLASND